jgi:hypothetical protein
MSSLLQFNGKVSKRGVELRFYLVDPESVYNYKGEPQLSLDEIELIDCPICGKQHPQLYTAWRKPAGMFGCWVVFRYNGEEHVPDLSIPIRVAKVPKGAKKLTPEENATVWHS